jgi:hypothetical protein
MNMYCGWRCGIFFAFLRARALLGIGAAKRRRALTRRQRELALRARHKRGSTAWSPHRGLTRAPCTPCSAQKLLRESLASSDMKIKLKTLKGEAYDQEVTPDMIVGKVKEVAAASEYGTSAGWDAEGMKLIFQGKVLDNDKDLASCEQQPASLPPRRLA